MKCGREGRDDVLSFPPSLPPLPPTLHPILPSHLLPALPLPPSFPTSIPSSLLLPPSLPPSLPSLPPLPPFPPSLLSLPSLGKLIMINLESSMYTHASTHIGVSVWRCCSGIFPASWGGPKTSPITLRLSPSSRL